MIITRAPLRVSFAGGGSDLPCFYERYGPGIVVSSSINKYVYVTLNRKFDGKVSVRYRSHENVDRVENLEHKLIREALLHYGIRKNIEIVIISEVPARGSGLGASSALAVALVGALERFTKNSTRYFDPEDKRKIAAIASDIEINRVGSPIGRQDHYASAFGGLNMIKFHRDRTEVYPFLSMEFVEWVQSYSMLFYLNFEHSYFDDKGHRLRGKMGFVQTILKEQIQEIEEKKTLYELQRDNALRMFENMEYEEINRFADHINENWRIKKSIHPGTSSAEIDEILERAYSNGAIAAKVCGAGGGGFFYVMAPPDEHDSLRKELKDHRELEFSFNSSGVETVLNESGTGRLCEIS